jgi:hypothetical protein
MQHPGQYRKETLRHGVDACYDPYDQLACVIVFRSADGLGAQSDTYMCSSYLDDGQLIFAFYDGKDFHRLYFYEGVLMRWRYTAENPDAVNYDFSFTDSYFLWLDYALQEVASFQ